MSEEGTRENISDDTKNDEGQSGTICDANNGTCNQIVYRDTTNDNSTRDTTKGAKVGGTIDDISTGNTTKE
jgi:hypothetical protein